MAKKKKVNIFRPVYAPNHRDSSSYANGQKKEDPYEKQHEVNIAYIVFNNPSIPQEKIESIYNGLRNQYARDPVRSKPSSIKLMTEDRLSR